MKKKIIIGLLAFILLAGAGLFIYINKIFLPVKLREIIQSRAEEFLGRKVTYRSIDYQLFQGLVVDNLTIYDKDDPSLIFVHLDQIKLNVLLTPVLQKKIIVPSVIITRPQINLIRKEPAVWNFSDLLAKRRPAGAKSPFNVMLGGVTIDQGQIEFTDKSGAVTTTEKFENINVKAHLSIKTGIRFELDTKMQPDTSLSMAGNYDIPGRKLTAQVKTRKLDPFKYVKMFFIPPNFIHRSGIIETAELRIKVNVATPPVIEARGSATISNADVTIQGNKIIQGELITGTSLVLTRKGFETHLTGDVTAKKGNVILANGKSFAGDAAAVQGLDLTGGFEKVDVTGKFDVQNARFVLAPEKILSGDLSSKQLSFKRDGTVMSAKGDLLAQSAQLNIGETHQYQGTFSSPRLTYQFHEGDIQAQGRVEAQDADFTIGTKASFTGNFISPDTVLTLSKDKQLQVSGQVQVTQGYLGLPQERAFTGDPVIDFKAARDLNSESPFIYSGSMTVQNATLKGLPKVDQAKNIAGKVHFANDQIQSDSLKLQTMDSDITLAGTLTDFRNPSVNVEASSADVDLEKIRPFIAGLLEKYQVTPAGTADLTIRYSGPLNNAKTAAIAVAADLRGASLAGKPIPNPITNISGKVNYSGRGVSWKNLTGTFKDTVYTLSGQVENFQEPLIETDIRSSQLNLTAAIQAREGIYKIQSLKGTYLNSDFNIKGSYHPAEGNAEVNLSGRIDLRLEDLTSLLPQYKKNIESYKPAGRIAIDAELTGKIKNWRNWQLTAAGSGESMTINGYQLRDVTLELQHGQQPTSRLDINAKFYNGPLYITMFVDPRRDDLAMTLAANLKNSDLEQLAKDVPSKSKAAEFKGSLAVDLSLEGPLTQTARWQGRGSAAIEDGQIFKFNLLKGIWRTMLIPEFEEIMFTHARTNFEIRKKRVVTRDLVLSSAAVDLSAAGWVDFDQNVNLNVNPHFKELTILQSASLKKGPTALLAQAQEYINIKISGTLKKPSYNVNTQPVKVLEKTTGSIIDGVQGIFEDIIN